MTITAPVAVPAYSEEPRMDCYGAVLYRQYRISAHAIERYIERIGGDVGNLISDLCSSGLFDINRNGVSRRLCASVLKNSRDGGWALTNGKAVFFVKQDFERQVIVTTLPMEGHQKTSNKRIRGKK
jgi:hypothetical protein